MKKLIKAKEVAEMLSVCVSQVYKLVQQGSIPKPIKLGKRGSAWLISDIDAWIDSRIEERDMEVTHG
jgi:prophage regulatory protein